MAEPLSKQVKRLADVIMFEIPGEPSRSEGAIDCAIRLLRAAYAPPEIDGSRADPPLSGGSHPPTEADGAAAQLYDGPRGGDE